MALSERLNTPISTAELERRWQLVRAAMEAAEVGDEVLLLAKQGVAFVARDRAAGAKASEVAIERGDCGGRVIRTDDGRETPTLVNDVTRAVAGGGGGGQRTPRLSVRA